jgi:hypothetical protein
MIANSAVDLVTAFLNRYSTRRLVVGRKSCRPDRPANFTSRRGGERFNPPVLKYRTEQNQISEKRRGLRDKSSFFLVFRFARRLLMIVDDE